MRTYPPPLPRLGFSVPHYNLVCSKVARLRLRLKFRWEKHNYEAYRFIIMKSFFLTSDGIPMPMSSPWLPPPPPQMSSLCANFCEDFSNLGQINILGHVIHPPPIRDLIDPRSKKTGRKLKSHLFN